jgi:3-mercaptopyruvate sulfurtransferase SseA
MGDARMAPPGQEHRDVPGEYRAGHLPGAVFFDIEALPRQADARRGIHRERHDVPGPAGPYARQ